MFTMQSQHHFAGRRQAFTLVEVLISIALVLVIILGVNQVFGLTSRTIGGANAMSTIVRDARNAQTIITRDISNAEIDRAPFMYLRSEVMLAFRDRADQLGDKDYSPTSTSRPTVENALLTEDRDLDGTEDAAVSRAFMTKRAHRMDLFKFFSRQTSRRQTGNSTSFTSGVSASELYIVYGHLRQPTVPNNLTTGALPGIGPSGTVLTPATNPNNFYATQFVLGRNAFLLREPETVGTSKVIRDYTVSGFPVQTYYGRGGTQQPNDSMAPFSESSRSTMDGVGNNASELVQYSFYDLMGMGMERYRTEILPVYINGYPDGSGTKRLNDWFTPEIDYRHTGYPTPSRPLTVQGVSRTVNCFVNACTQFVVEYAGDFVPQNQTGGIDTAVLATGGTDGIVDFNLVNGERTIRWYGFPRDTSGDGQIRRIDDVVPLRDYVGQQARFERTLPTTTLQADYGTAGTIASNAQYVCVWGPDTAALPRPKMLRIVMAIDDPAARIGAEQYFEFVVELP